MDNRKWYFYIGWKDGDPKNISGMHQNTPEGIRQKLEDNKREGLIYKVYGGYKTKKIATNRLNKAVETAREDFFSGLGGI